MTLAKLETYKPGIITGFAAPSTEAEIRLREIGFAEGDVIRILHKGLFGGSPLNVQLHGTSFALRPGEAEMIIVESCER